MRLSRLNPKTSTSTRRSLRPRIERRFSEGGFSELEFVFLVLSGLALAGLLAHFVFDQSLQVERLKVLLARDSVRMAFETRLTDPTVLRKSARGLAKTEKNANLRACILGLNNCQAKSGKDCCISHLKIPMVIVDLGDTRKVIGGTKEEPSCLSQSGESDPSQECFATAHVIAEPICGAGRTRCQQASVVLLEYHLQFLSPFLSTEPQFASVERTLSVVLGPN